MAIEINYFDFLRMCPNIILDNIGAIDKIDYINYIELLWSDCDSKKPLIEIDQQKLSDIVYNRKTNDDKSDIFKNDIRVTLCDQNIIIILHTDNRKIFGTNNVNEKKGKFFISGKFNLFLDKDFYYMSDNQIKNIKRSLLIDKCLK